MSDNIVYTGNFLDAYIETYGTILYTANACKDYDIGRLLPDGKPILLESYVDALYRNTVQYLDNRILPTKDEDLSRMLKLFIQDKNYLVTAYFNIVPLKLQNILHVSNPNNSSINVRVSYISENFASNIDSNRETQSFKYDQRYKSKYNKYEVAYDAYVSEVTNCYTKAVNTIKEKYKYMSIPSVTNNIDLTCSFCIDIHNKLQLHRSKLIEKHKLYMKKDDILIALTIDPRENKTHASGYKKILFIPPSHTFPTMTSREGYGDGIYKPQAGKVNWGAYIYNGLYKSNPSKAKELADFLTASYYGAIRYAEAVYGGKFVHAKTSGYQYDLSDTRSNRIYQWVHGYTNTVPHLHIHTMIVKEGGKLAEYLHRDILNPLVMFDGPYPFSMNILEYCRVCTNTLIEKPAAYKFKIIDATKITDDDSYNTKMSVLSCNNVAYTKLQSSVNLPGYQEVKNYIESKQEARNILYRKSDKPTLASRPQIAESYEKLFEALKEKYDGIIYQSDDRLIINSIHNGSFTLLADAPNCKLNPDPTAQDNILKLYSVYNIIKTRAIRGVNLTAGYITDLPKNTMTIKSKAKQKDVEEERDFLQFVKKYIGEDISVTPAQIEVMKEINERFPSLMK